MFLSTDLSVREQYGSASAVSRGTLASSGGSFSQFFSAAFQAGGGTNYDEYFQRAADTYQVPVNLIKALAKAESNFDANAVSRCGAQGVMQLMPATARAMGVTNAFDPAQNIMGGTKYFRQMLDTFGGDVTKAIAAYNAGPGAIKKYGGMLPSQAGYVNKVLEYAGGVSVAAAGGGGFAGLPDSGGFQSADDSLTGEDLVDLILQADGLDDDRNREYVRLLLEQLFLKKALDQEEREPDESL